MAEFTLADLREIVRQCEEDPDALQESSLASSFRDLGYDSLMVYEMVTRIQDDYAVRLSDEELDGLDTPAALIDHVSKLLAAA
jgi:acyl carrier protein